MLNKDIFEGRRRGSVWKEPGDGEGFSTFWVVAAGGRNRALGRLCSAGRAFWDGGAFDDALVGCDLELPRRGAVRCVPLGSMEQVWSWRSTARQRSEVVPALRTSSLIPPMQQRGCKEGSPARFCAPGRAGRVHERTRKAGDVSTVQATPPLIRENGRV